jgi:hypothetical protein
MRLASVMGFLLVVIPVHAQDLPLSQETHISDEFVSRNFAQPLPDKPQPIAHEGQWIATGEQLPLFHDDLVITERKEDGHLMWQVERVDSCTWCGKPMTWKQAAFDRKAISLWGLRIAMEVTDIEITHHAPCFLASTCREDARKGSKTYHVGGYRKWFIIPVIGQASSVVGIIANLARWNHK